MHLGVNSELGVYSCWRNPAQHRGRTLHKLIMLLRKCSYAEARTILGQQPLWLKEDQFNAFADNPSEWFTKQKEEPNKLELSQEMRSFGSSYTSEQLFVSYLVNRGFYKSTILQFTQQYRLRWAVSGKFKNRIIIPNWLEDNLVNWTGRSIEAKQNVRYLTLSEGNGAIINIKKIIFNWDQLIKQPGHLVVVCEGPFDALKLDWFGRARGLRATCLFGQMATMEQVAYIAALTDLYHGVIVMLDNTAAELAESLCDQLHWLPVRYYPLPDGVKDPGELSFRAVCQLNKELTTFMETVL